MLLIKAFLKKTSRGKVKQARNQLPLTSTARHRAHPASLQVVQEHYLRTDIYCGSPLAAPEHRGACAPSRLLASPLTP
jgi:hypothetical protein